MPHDDEAV